MTRKKDRDPKSRTKLVSVRIDAGLYEALARRAEVEGASLTDVLRDRLSGGAGATRSDMRKVAELHRIGTLLQRIAESSGGGDQIPALAEVQGAIMRIVPHLP